MENDGGRDSIARELIYVTRGTGKRVLAQGRLQALGWRLNRAPDPRSVQRILSRDLHQPHAALIDLREGFDSHDLASFAPMLSASNVGWVAGVDASQLE